MARNRAFRSLVSLILIATVIIVTLVTIVLLLFVGLAIFTMVYRAMTG